MSPLASRIGVDSAGGLLGPPLQVFVTIAGVPWAVLGTQVASHGPGSHGSASMGVIPSHVSIAGVPVVFAGAPATCGHLATGSGHVTVTP